LFTAVLLFAAANSISSDRKLTSKQRTKASRLYNTRCIACHRLYDPIAYSDDEWKLWMARMSRKARLDPNQEKLLDRYLDDCRAVAKSTK
jgi:hypothetical protein